MKKIFISILLLVSFVAQTAVAADSVITDDISGTTDICAPFKLAKDLANRAFSILVPVMVIMIMIAGIYRMMYGFEKKNLERSMKIIKGAIVGMIVALLAWSIVTVYIGALGYVNLAKDWWNLTCSSDTTNPIDWENPAFTDPDPKCGISQKPSEKECTQELPFGVYKVKVTFRYCNGFSKQASSQLLDSIACMAFVNQDTYGEATRISGVGEADNACYAKCIGPEHQKTDPLTGKPICLHQKYSLHYGCGSVWGKSFAVDIRLPVDNPTQLREDALRWYAIAVMCDASMIIGPTKDVTNLQGLTEEQLQKILDGHRDHMHIGFCGRPPGASNEVGDFTEN